MLLRRLLPLLLLVPLFGVACGDDDDEEERPKGTCTIGDASSCKDGLECQAVAGSEPKCFCSNDRDTGCDKDLGLVCELIEGGNSGCFAPVSVEGRVFDLGTDAPIEGALVVARDANFAADSGVAVSGPDGKYSLRVRVPRNAEGVPRAKDVTLRADAMGYLTFPSAPRIALPVALDSASGDPLVVVGAATDIGMIPLASSTGLGSISGKVLSDAPRGTLVVAGGTAGQGGGVTGVADFDGSYTVFNVPAGTVPVSGYKQGLQLVPTTAAVVASENTAGIDLATADRATSTVTGKVDIVNPGAGKDTSVILVVSETFVPNAARGEAPPGLRAWPVSGAFSISGVPDGNYVVLAAFENDFLVRDPDTAIGGTAIVEITVAGDTAMPQSFKVTGALDVVSPDREQVVSGTPRFIWVDDSGEESYQLVVFDAYGTKIWEHLSLPKVTGSKNVEVDYGTAGGSPETAPALTPGMLYQFRAMSIKQGGTPISKTEDLRGTFVYQ